jgi:hypothetical protein
MRSETLKEEAISSEMRQPDRLPKLRNAGPESCFGSFQGQAYGGRMGEILSISGQGQTLGGLNPRRVSALRPE